MKMKMIHIPRLDQAHAQHLVAHLGRDQNCTRKHRMVGWKQTWKQDNTLVQTLLSQGWMMQVWGVCFQWMLTICLHPYACQSIHTSYKTVVKLLLIKVEVILTFLLIKLIIAYGLTTSFFVTVKCQYIKLIFPFKWDFKFDSFSLAFKNCKKLIWVRIETFWMLKQH